MGAVKCDTTVGGHDGEMPLSLRLEMMQGNATTVSTTALDSPCPPLFSSRGPFLYHDDVARLLEIISQTP